MKRKKLLILITILSFNLNSNAQDFKKKYLELSQNKEVNNEKEKIVFEATNYIFSNKPNIKSEEFIYATKIAGFWMNLNTKYGMPIFGKFYNILSVRGNQFLYTTAMMHYLIQQKIEKDRLIIFVKKEGVKFSELETVKETQLEGAKILLNYFSKYKISISKKTEKYLKKFQAGEIENYFFGK